MKTKPAKPLSLRQQRTLIWLATAHDEGNGLVRLERPDAIAVSTYESLRKRGLIAFGPKDGYMLLDSKMTWTSWEAKVTQLGLDTAKELADSARGETTARGLSADTVVLDEVSG